MVQKSHYFSPTHSIFADDILIFCNASLKGLRNLIKLMDWYQGSSGLCFNKSKCKLFPGRMNRVRKRQIEDLLNIKEGKLLEFYLGVPLFKRRVKHEHISYLLDKIRRKVAGWVRKNLSLQGRMLLAKHVLNSVTVHNMAIYKWPTKLAKEGDKELYLEW
ncbi:Ribonuclease h protein [Thalictrum thalictroides]|uniref:Ribonuclease h protein n=1 Tax=Thalictrum thalictroides TaxID=46969 RepID=A0A7J6WZC3_THATH|nr:Ribonuclease h protein [Thalictrum thalictroides]